VQVSLRTSASERLIGNPGHRLGLYETQSALSAVGRHEMYLPTPGLGPSSGRSL